MTPEPQRRDNDRDRRRWNDTALDQLEARVGTVEDELNVAHALAGLPERVSGLKDAVEQLRLQQRDAAGLEERRIASVRGDIGELRSAVTTGLQGVETEVGRDRGVDWKTVMAVAATIAVPIVMALIAVLAK